MTASVVLDSTARNTPTATGDALTATFRQVGPAMYRQALAVLGDRATALDVVQEAFLRTWKRRERLRDADQLDGYLVPRARGSPSGTSASATSARSACRSSCRCSPRRATRGCAP